MEFRRFPELGRADSISGNQLETCLEDSVPDHHFTMK